MRITKRRKLCRGLTARPTKSGFVAVNLLPEADPVAAEHARQDRPFMLPSRYDKAYRNRFPKP